MLPVKVKNMFRDMFDLVKEDAGAPSIGLAEIKKITDSLPKKITDLQLKPLLSEANGLNNKNNLLLETQDHFNAAMIALQKHCGMKSPDEVVHAYLAGVCKKWIMMKRPPVDTKSMKERFDDLGKNRRDMDNAWKAYKEKNDDIHPLVVAVVNSGGSLRAVVGAITGKGSAAAAASPAGSPRGARPPPGRLGAKKPPEPELTHEEKDAAAADAKEDTKSPTAPATPLASGSRTPVDPPPPPEADDEKPATDAGQGGADAGTAQSTPKDPAVDSAKQSATTVVPGSAGGSPTKVLSRQNSRVDAATRRGSYTEATAQSPAAAQPTTNAQTLTMNIPGGAHVVTPSDAVQQSVVVLPQQQLQEHHAVPSTRGPPVDKGAQAVDGVPTVAQSLLKKMEAEKERLRADVEAELRRVQEKNEQLSALRHKVYQLRKEALDEAEAENMRRPPMPVPTAVPQSRTELDEFMKMSHEAVQSRLREADFLKAAEALQQDQIALEAQQRAEAHRAQLKSEVLQLRQGWMADELQRREKAVKEKEAALQRILELQNQEEVLAREVKRAEDRRNRRVEKAKQKLQAHHDHVAAIQQQQYQLGLRPTPRQGQHDSSPQYVANAASPSYHYQQQQPDGYQHYYTLHHDPMAAGPLQHQPDTGRRYEATAGGTPIPGAMKKQRKHSTARRTSKGKATEGAAYRQYPHTTGVEPTPTNATTMNSNSDQQQRMRRTYGIMGLSADGAPPVDASMTPAASQNPRWMAELSHDHPYSPAQYQQLRSVSRASGVVAEPLHGGSSPSPAALSQAFNFNLVTGQPPRGVVSSPHRRGASPLGDPELNHIIQNVWGAQRLAKQF